MAGISDLIGNRGQAICELLLTELDNRGYPLFKPQFLGDKWRTVDLLVELEGRHAAVPFFFVQVKATTQGYTYLVSTYRAPKVGWSSLSTAFPLNTDNRRLLTA